MVGYNLLFFLFIVAASLIESRGKAQFFFAISAFIALAPLSMPWIPLSLAVLFIACEKMRKGSGIFLIALLTPLLPAFGMGTLLAAIFLMLAVYKDGKNLLSLGRTLPFLLAVFAWVVWEGINDIPNILNWFKSFKALPPQSFYSAADALRLLLVVVLFNLFKNNEKTVLRGLVYGMTVAAVAVLATLCFPTLEQLLPNQSALWNSMGRHTGTFSDPNAFGLFAALSLPILIYSGKIFNRRYDYILALFWTGLGCFSGSRSFILALALYVAIAIFLRSKKLFFALALAAIAVWGTGTFFAKQYPTQFQQYETKLPRSLERVSQAAFSECIDSTVYSRRVFWGINFDMLVHPALSRKQSFVGHGFNQYEKYFPYYLEKSGIDLGVWRDSPNNFYLGLLIELGLIGFALFIIAASGFYFIKDEEQNRLIPKVGVLMLSIILLFFGPHLHFDELIVAIAILMVLSCHKREGYGRTLSLSYILLACFLCLVVKAKIIGLGLYPLEADSNGKFSWTDSYAEVLLSPEKKDLTFRLEHKDIGKHPIGFCADEICKTIAKNQKENFEFNGCDEVTILGKTYCKHTLKVTNTWVPAQMYPDSTDRRRLGTKIRY